MLGSREDAEDVLQEVFAASYNAIKADARDINVRPWLYRIARNRCLNHLRRPTQDGRDTMDDQVHGHGITTADLVSRRADFRTLLQDIQKLPETQRTALLLREMDALSYEQIAEAMDNTVPSVKSLLVRARMSLAEAAEARQLTCTDVRLELAEVAEGLKKTTPPVARHVRECDQCGSYRDQLKKTSTAMALALPLGPFLILKKLFLAKVGAAAAGGAALAARRRRAEQAEPERQAEPRLPERLRPAERRQRARQAGWRQAAASRAPVERSVSAPSPPRRSPSPRPPLCLRVARSRFATSPFPHTRRRRRRSCSRSSSGPFSPAVSRPPRCRPCHW